MTVSNPDGTPNFTAALGTFTGNSTALRVTVNPNDNRQVAVVGLAQSAGVNMNVSAVIGGSTKTASDSFVISGAPPPPDQSGIQLGAWGPEIDPPSWA